MTDTVAEPAIWAITDHICGQCLGRLLAYGASRSSMVYRCSECGETGAGKRGLDHPPMCMCAARIGERNAGIRCVRNPEPSPTKPWEIVAREIKTGNETKKGAARKRRDNACDRTAAFPEFQ